MRPDRLKKASKPDIRLAPVAAANAGKFQLRVSAWQNRQCVLLTFADLTIALPFIVGPDFNRKTHERKWDAKPVGLASL